MGAASDGNDGTAKAGLYSGADLAELLRGALAGAVRNRDTVAVSALRSALGAIGNAEAVSAQPSAAGASSPHVAGAAAGVGAAEAPRRRLSPADVRQIVQSEVGERLKAALDYEHAGHAERARRLRLEAEVLLSAAQLDDSEEDSTPPEH